MAAPVIHTDDLNALARQDRRLAIERQAVEILADHDIGDDTGPGPTFLDRQVGRWPPAISASTTGSTAWAGYGECRAGIFSNASVRSLPSWAKWVTAAARANRSQGAPACPYRWQIGQNPHTFAHGGRERRWLRLIRL